MDWDELRPKTPKAEASVGDNLETLSVAELEARITLCEGEIARTREELTKKRAHESAASALFKRPGT